MHKPLHQEKDDNNILIDVSQLFSDHMHPLFFIPCADLRHLYTRSLKSKTATTLVRGPNTFWKDERAGGLKKGHRSQNLRDFCVFLLCTVGGRKPTSRTRLVQTATPQEIKVFRKTLCCRTQQFTIATGSFCVPGGYLKHTQRQLVCYTSVYL